MVDILGLKSTHVRNAASTLLFTTLLGLGGIACAQTRADPAASEVKPSAERASIIQVFYRSQAELQAIASQFQHVSVDVKSASVTTEAMNTDIQALIAAGIRVRIDEAKTTQLRAGEDAMLLPLSQRSISGFACYRTVEETYQSMATMATTFPNLAQVVDIGPSFEKSRNASAGYTMKVLVLGNRSNDASVAIKPNMVVLSSIHAREYTPAELMTRFAEGLLAGYGTDPEATWLLDHNRFHLVLQANPDGRKKAETGLSWRKNTNNSNGTCSGNTFGTDLNRNFAFHWNTVPGGSSADKCNDTYHGPSAGSEVETQNIIRYVAGTKGSTGVYSGGVLSDLRADALTAAAPTNYRGMFMDIHSFSQLVLWPWGDTASAAPNSTALRALGRRLAYFNNYSPQQSAQLYATDGATDDNFYGSLGAPAYTLELGVAFFESCANFTSSTLPKNVAALRYAARTLNAPYQLPGGPDASALSATPSSVAAGGSVNITATVDDTRFNQSNGTEATQNINAANVYIDTLPWATGAVAIAMSASDGSFNAASESVRATVSTTGLSNGKHVAYVQGIDASGAAGTPNAVNFTVGAALPPSTTFSNSTPFAIKDNTTIESPLAVTGIAGNAPATLTVNVNITHTYQGDLKLDLIAPNGTAFNLWNRTGGGTDNIIRSFSVNAASVSAVGTWKLRVNDNGAGDTGTLNSWSLTF
jgi:carboxypeptidase T